MDTGQVKKQKQKRFSKSDIHVFVVNFRSQNKSQLAGITVCVQVNTHIPTKSFVKGNIFILHTNLIVRHTRILN